MSITQLLFYLDNCANIYQRMCTAIFIAEKLKDSDNLKDLVSYVKNVNHSEHFPYEILSIISSISRNLVKDDTDIVNIIKNYFNNEDDAIRCKAIEATLCLSYNLRTSLIQDFKKVEKNKDVLETINDNLENKE